MSKNNNLHKTLRPVMEQLAEKFGYAVMLNIMVENRRICIGKVESKRDIHFSVPLGRLLPVYQAAIGRGSAETGNWGKWQSAGVISTSSRSMARSPGNTATRSPTTAATMLIRPGHPTTLSIRPPPRESYSPFPTSTRFACTNPICTTTDQLILVITQRVTNAAYHGNHLKWVLY